MGRNVRVRRGDEREKGARPEAEVRGEEEQDGSVDEEQATGYGGTDGRVGGLDEGIAAATATSSCPARRS